MASIPLIMMGGSDTTYQRIAAGGVQGATNEYLTSQTAINMYFKPNPNGGPGAWVPSMGATAPDTAVGAAVVRGMHWDEINNQLYVVSGNDLSRFTDSTETDIGDLTTSTGRVRFAANIRTNELLIVDGAKGYILDMNTDTLTEIGDSDYPDESDVCAILDGFFIVANSGATNSRIQWSALNDGTTWDALDFATKEGGQDKLIDIIVNNRDLYLLGDLSSEVWYNSGDLDQLFQRYQGGYIEMGVAAIHMATICDNRVMFPGRNKRGSGPVVALNGSQIEIISNQHVSSLIEEVRWNSSGNPYGFGYAFYEEGHEFYAMSNVKVSSPTIPTILYDASTKLWHQRAHYDGTTFPSGEIWTSVEYDRGGLDTSIGKLAYGHRSTGALYLRDSTSSNIVNAGTGNNTDAVPRRLIGPMIRSDTRIRFSEVTLEVGTEAGSGPMPASEISLYVSKDGGNTWSSAITMNQDDGTYDGDGALYRAHNLGAGKNWRFRIDFNTSDQAYGVKGFWGKPYGDSDPRVTYG